MIGIRYLKELEDSIKFLDISNTKSNFVTYFNLMAHINGIKSDRFNSLKFDPR